MQLYKFMLFQKKIFKLINTNDQIQYKLLHKHLQITSMSFNDFVKLHFQAIKQLSQQNSCSGKFFPLFLQGQLKSSINSLGKEMGRSGLGFMPCQYSKELKTDEASEQKNDPDVSDQIDEEKANIQLKNDTKNIPKNFGKAIIAFIRKNPHIVKRVLSAYNVNLKEYLYALKRRKNKLNNIASLRSLWLDDDFRFAKVTRIISENWMKRGSLQYIFSSRISNYRDHVKYRKRMLEALNKPAQFTHIKTNTFS